MQVSETVFDTINHEYDKTEQKRAKQKKAKFGTDEKDSDCILHGYIKKLVNICLQSAHFYWHFESREHIGSFGQIWDKRLRQKYNCLYYSCL